MKCDECDKDIAGTYFEKDGKPICEKDYEKYRKKCSVCNEFITGSYYTTKDDKLICAKDYKAQQGGSTNCAKCGKEALGQGEILRALDSVFHPACFACCVCGVGLATNEINAGFSLVNYVDCSINAGFSLVNNYVDGSINAGFSLVNNCM
jgi:hypothetical protein